MLIQSIVNVHFAKDPLERQTSCPALDQLGLHANPVNLFWQHVRVENMTVVAVLQKDPFLVGVVETDRDHICPLHRTGHRCHGSVLRKDLIDVVRSATPVTVHVFPVGNHAGDLEIRNPENWNRVLKGGVSVGPSVGQPDPTIAADLGRARLDDWLPELEAKRPSCLEARGEMILQVH